MAKRPRLLIRSYICLTFLACSLLASHAQTDPLPSWNDTAPSKKSRRKASLGIYMVVEFQKQLRPAKTGTFDSPSLRILANTVGERSVLVNAH